MRFSSDQENRAPESANFTHAQQNSLSNLHMLDGRQTSKRSEGYNPLRLNGDPFMSYWVGEEFENNSQPMCAFDQKTLAFLCVNKAAVRQLGFSVEEFSAMTLNDLLNLGEATAIVDACVKAPSTHLPLRFGPYMIRKKDGTVIASEIHCQSIPFEDKDAIFMLVAKPRQRDQHKTSRSGT